MTGDFDERLQEWLGGLPGVTEPRRVVRRDAGRVLVSKFEAGFAAHLHDVLDRLPELFETPVVAVACAARASAYPAGTRVNTWRTAIDEMLTALAAERGISARDVTDVRGGLDSVAALLDSILWSAPLAGDRAYVPAPGELDAYNDALRRMEGDANIFTRLYGTFEGANVVNYCPAATFGRVLFVQAWDICTGGDTAMRADATRGPIRQQRDGASPPP
jgi:hypothetical protein